VVSNIGRDDVVKAKIIAVMDMIGNTGPTV